MFSGGVEADSAELTNRKLICLNICKKKEKFRGGKLSREGGGGHGSRRIRGRRCS